MECVPQRYPLRLFLDAGLLGAFFCRADFFRACTAELMLL
jgi:hypothetical protein